MNAIAAIQTDDYLRYRLVASRTLAQEDARIRVDVTALVSTGQTDQVELERRIRGALMSFVAAEWSFSAIRRLGEAVGFERLCLQASARVPNREIYNLEERARRASTEGLALGAPKVDYRLPSKRVNEIVQELRAEIVQEVKHHIEQFRQLTGRSWRIGDIVFGAWDPRDEFRTTKGAYRSTSGSEEVAYLAEAEEQGIFGTERITLVAEVSLRAPGGPQ